MSEIKLTEITQVADFPIERRLAKHLHRDKAYELIEVARTAVREYLENSEDNFSEMYFHYTELCYPSEVDVKSVFSEAEATETVLSLIRITE